MGTEKLIEKSIENILDTKNINQSLDNLKQNISSGTELNLLKGMVDVQNNQNIKEKASGFMSMIGGILNINVPMFGNLGELFETKRPADILGKNKKNNKFLNGVLKFFGIQDGVAGLHKNYINEQLSHVDTEFTKEVFSYFSANTKAEIIEENTLRKKYNLETIAKGLNLKEEEITKLKEKIPTDYQLIKESLTRSLPNNINKLSINAVAMIGDEYITMVDNKPTINQDKIIQNPEVFVDKYLSVIVPKLLTSGDEFINSEYTNKETFALGIFGNLVGEKFFIEGINIGSIVAQEYKNNTTDTITNKNIETPIQNQEKIKQDIQSELNKYTGCPLTPDMIFTAATTNKVPVEYIMAIMRNDSSYGTAGVGANTHNPGNVGNTDDRSTKDRGTRENGVNAVAKNLSRRIEEYQKVYGSTTMPSIKELANNQGPDNKGFLPNQANYKINNPDRKGAYMTAKTGGDNVQQISDQLAQSGISSKNSENIA